VRLIRCALACAALFAAAPGLRAEYVVLRSGQRLNVTGYQMLGDKYRLQMMGGSVEVSSEEIVRIEPEEVFTPLPVTANPKAPFREIIQTAAARYNVDPELISSVIAVESNFNPRAASRRNARGLMQLLPETAARLGVQNIFDPRENIDAGTRYLRDLLQRYDNNLVLALAAYNAGPERVQQYGSVPPYAETISYVRRVRLAYEKRKPGGSTKAAGRNTPVASSATRSSH
jgi:hypothetical protein